MRIDHVAVYVKDLEKCKRFFENYFGASSGVKYHNTATGLSTYFLSFSDGSRLELMSRPDMAEGTEALIRCGYIHLAFSVGSKEMVDRLTDRLKKDGYQVLSGPRVTGDGYYESCVLGPENNQIEIVE